ncbi:MAG: CoA pyrophosphatase [Acidimicrobiales bacterium]
MARQLIPRPSTARRVGPDETAEDLAGAPERLSLGAVRAVFGSVLTTPDACSTRAQVEGVAAAVLAVLVPGTTGGESAPAAVVLIRRASHMRANPGEIALPGGRIERGEEALAAALREAEEEVGLDPGLVEVIGTLPVASVYRHPVPIRPFVAATRVMPDLVANPDEVDGIIVVPLSDLVAPGRYWQEEWDQGGGKGRRMHFFSLGDDVIWGATARMLHSLLSRLNRKAPPA